MKPRTGLYIVVLSALMMIAAASVAAAPVPVQPAAVDPFAQRLQHIEQASAAAASDKALDETARKLIIAEAQQNAAYQAWRRQFVQDSWEWHLLSTQLLMYVVLVIVGFGLYLTYVQFTRPLPARRRTAPANAVTTAAAAPPPAAPGVAPPAGAGAIAAADPQPPDHDAALPVHKLKIGLDGLELSSQIVGVIILGFSLAFFYCYVKDIYPVQQWGEKIEQAHPGKPADTSEKPAPKPPSSPPAQTGSAAGAA